ncbi:MAG: hypothetical protein HKM28_03255 [Flavobacteriaceae bacterium]|nr:hypothetical protein [Flavobacteriaceae bacterium]
MNDLTKTNYYAALAYLTFIGWIVALILNQKDRSELVAFHLRQMLGLMLLYVSVSVLDSVINFPLLFWIMYLAVIVLWIFGLIAALRKETTPLPFIGIYFEDWFRSI